MSGDRIDPELQPFPRLPQLAYGSTTSAALPAGTSTR